MPWVSPPARSSTASGKRWKFCRKNSVKQSLCHGFHKLPIPYEHS